MAKCLWTPDNHTCFWVCLCKFIAIQLKSIFDVRYWYWMRRPPGSQSVFQFNPMVFSSVEATQIPPCQLFKPCLYGSECVHRGTVIQKQKKMPPPNCCRKASSKTTVCCSINNNLACNLTMAVAKTFWRVPHHFDHIICLDYWYTMVRQS